MTTRDAIVPSPTPGRAGASAWLVVTGSGFILLGGLVAALTGPLEWGRGSWLAAYMVLVCGVAQFVMGRAPSWFGRPTSNRLAWTQLAGWNIGNLTVIGGTLAELPNVVDVGGVVLLVILVDMLRDAIRRPGRDTGAPAGAGGAPPAAAWIGRQGWWAYRALLVLLIVSVPVGLVLAHLRGG